MQPDVLIAFRNGYELDDIYLAGLLEQYYQERVEAELNIALNKALITDKIKNPNSNTIAEFVTNYLKKQPF